MNTSYALQFERTGGNIEVAGDAVGAYKTTDDAVVVTGPPSFVRSWTAYFETSESWREVHMASGSPLESLFGQGSYSTVRVLDGTDAESQYEAAIKQIGGKSVTITMKAAD
jgi:hypothetical protein